jgi:hypothetical protein
MNSILAITSTMLLAATSCGAALIASEDFETQSLGGLDGQSGGTGFSGTWSASNQISVVESTLSYSNGAVSVHGGG